MAKARTILQAGKQVAKAVGERVAKGKGLKERPESLLNDPAAQKQGGAKPASAEAEAAQEPGNPNEIDHGEKQSGQDATG